MGSMIDDVLLREKQLLKIEGVLNEEGTMHCLLQLNNVDWK
jgi:hypothetical protein